MSRRKEKMYFEHGDAVVSNKYIVYKNKSQHSDMVIKADINHRAFRIYTSLTLCILTLGLLVISPKVFILAVGAAFIWFRWECEQYIELFLTKKDGTRLRFAAAPPWKRKILYDMSDAVNKMAEERNTASSNTILIRKSEVKNGKK